MPAAIAHAHWHSPVNAIGDRTILNQHPIHGFFCSQRYPAKTVLPTFEWGKKAREEGICVMSGFHSLLEKELFAILQDGKQPMIWVTARTLPKRLPPTTRQAVEDSRLLIISPVETSRATVQSAIVRNRFILAVAENLIVAHAAPNGNLANLLATASKPIHYLAK